VDPHEQCRTLPGQRGLAGPDVRIELAGGLAEKGALGTDAVRVMEAIGRADAGDGVLVLMDLGSPSRDTLEEMLAVSRALAKPIAMFVDQSDEDMIGAAIDAGVSAYVVDGLRKDRVKPILDLAIRRAATRVLKLGSLHS